mgnify:CR=1 FL=1
MNRRIALRGVALDVGCGSVGPVQTFADAWLSLDRANRARPGQPVLGSVREPPSQRATGYIARAAGSVGGPLPRSVGKALNMRRLRVPSPLPETRAIGPRRPDPHRMVHSPQGIEHEALK